MSALIQYISPLVQSAGPGILESNCIFDIFYVGAITSLICSFLGILSTCLMYHGTRNSRYEFIGVAFTLHSAASLLVINY